MSSSFLHHEGTTDLGPDFACQRGCRATRQSPRNIRKRELIKTSCCLCWRKGAAPKKKGPAPAKKPRFAFGFPWLKGVVRGSSPFWNPPAPAKKENTQTKRGPRRPRRVDPVQDAWAQLQGQREARLHQGIPHGEAGGVLTELLAFEGPGASLVCGVM